MLTVLSFTLMAGPQKFSKNNQALTWEKTLLDVGNWRYYMTARGEGGYDPESGYGGGYYPLEGNVVIYKDGLLWAGWLKNPITGEKIAEQPLRAGGIFYRTSMQPGWINEDGSPANPKDAQTWIYRFTKMDKLIGTDFLERDASYLLNIPIDQITMGDINQISDKEANDTMNWPVQYGAPFIDGDENGKYEFGIDQPGFAQSDQIVWNVINDLDSGAAYFATGSWPIGIEIKITAWTYAGKFSPQGQVIFKRYQFINKSDYLLDSLFVGIWVDADIGYYADDLAGCDSTRNFFYVYNGNWIDEESSTLGLAPPAVGIKVLQGPIVFTGNLQDTALFHQHWKAGYKNLGLSAFNYLARPFLENNPPGGSRLTTYSIFNLLRGYFPYTELNYLQPFKVGYGPRKGQFTRFPLNGNPITGQGDLDGMGNNPKPGDRVVSGSFGPLTMKPGEEQEIIFAIIGGLGGDRLQSLAEVEKLLPFVNLYYRAAFTDIPRAPAYPEAKARPLGDKIVLNWGFDQDRVHEVEEQAPAGYRFEGYNIYQLKPVYKQDVSNVGARDYF
ncbi:MAG: hypothetical protein D6732_22135, partial [Methanobacteriota archaeon]